MQLSTGRPDAETAGPIWPERHEQDSTPEGSSGMLKHYADSTSDRLGLAIADRLRYGGNRTGYNGFSQGDTGALKGMEGIGRRARNGTSFPRFRVRGQVQ
jgi:hypothetical protein